MVANVCKIGYYHTGLPIGRPGVDAPFYLILYDLFGILYAKYYAINAPSVTIWVEVFHLQNTWKWLYVVDQHISTKNTILPYTVLYT